MQQSSLVSSADPASKKPRNGDFHLGVKVKVFNDILAELGEQSKTMNWYEVRDHPLMKSHFRNSSKLSYAEILYANPETQGLVGKSNVFLSNYHGHKFGEIVDLVTGHYPQGGDKDVFIWFDMFCMNHLQAIPSDELTRRIQSAIESTKTVLLSLSPWEKPDLLCRSWCLLEIYYANKFGKKIEVALSSQQRSALLAKLTSANLAESNSFTKILENIDFKAAVCEDPLDKIAIDEEVRDWKAHQDEVSRTLRNWLHSFLNAEVLKKKKEAWNLVIVRATLKLKLLGDSKTSQDKALNSIITELNWCLQEVTADTSDAYDRERYLTYDRLGECCLKLKNCAVSRNMHEKALLYAKEDYQRADLTSQIGSAYYGEGNYAEALKWHMEAIDLATKWNKSSPGMGMYADLGQYYNKVAFDHYSLQNITAAVEYFQKDLKFIDASPTLGKESRLMDAHHNLGAVLIMSDVPDKARLAIKHLQKAKDFKERILGLGSNGLAKTCVRLGDAYSLGTDPASTLSAVFEYEGAIRIFEHNGDTDDDFCKTAMDRLRELRPSLVRINSLF